MNRLCVFAHYDRDDLIDDYVLFYLQSLRIISTHIVFVTTSKINENEIGEIKTLCDQVISRDNVGYDFVSWQRGMKSVVNMSDFDEIVLCNDSVYGPLFPLSGIFETMNTKGADFWGITDSNQIAYHLQSYFLVFNRKITNSEVFKKFWNEVKIENNKKDIVKKYEVGLTRSFLSAGFKPSAYIPASSFTSRILRIQAISAMKNPSKALGKILSTQKHESINYRGLNPTLYFWKDMIVKHRGPFLKIELLRDNPGQIDIRGYSTTIRKYCDYDTDLIKKHLERIKRE
jgi:lipopolysaccharide biosynthesis protein